MHLRSPQWQQERNQPDRSYEKSMTLFMISIPLMALAAALAVLPLILMSHGDHRRRMAEATVRPRSTLSDRTDDVPAFPGPSTSRTEGR